jgi:predicted dehydrogenase
VTHHWRAALIGCGEIGAQHADAVAGIGGLRFDAYCDTTIAAAQALLDRHGGRYATADADRVFADPAVDVVYICTRHDSHVEYALRAAQAGKHMLIEKPMALTVAECQTIGDAVERAGVTAMTGFKLRFYQLVAHARRLMPEPQMATMQTMYDRLPDDRWVHDPVQGGGTVLSAGVHSVDLLRFLLGADPVTVTAAGANFYHRNGLIDNIAAVYRFGNGSVANLVQGDFNCPPPASTFYVQLFREDESLTLSDRLCRLVHRRGTGEPTVLTGTEDGIRRESQELVRALNTGVPPSAGHRDGWWATAMISAAVRAAGSGEPQHLPTPLQPAPAGQTERLTQR